MSERPNSFGIVEKLKLPKVFRQNGIIILVLATMFQIFYYPIFFYRRRKAMQKTLKIKRYYWHVALPFIGIGLCLVAILTLSFFIGIEEAMTHQDELIKGTLTVNDLTDKMVSQYKSLITMVNYIFYIVALLFFVLPAIDFLVLLSEYLKSIRVQFPKVIQWTPVLFTAAAFLHVFAEVFQVGFGEDVDVLILLSRLIFGVAIILFHIYMTNIYVLIQTFQIPKGEIK